MSYSKHFFSNSYFFIKYINCNSFILPNDKRIKSTSFSKSSVSKTHFVFHYNFLNNKFISFLRSNFFTYSVVINSSKKSILRRNVPTIFKNYFNNSSFIVTMPSKDIADTFFFYKSLRSTLESFPSSSRFSIYFFSIFIDNCNFPIEFFDYFLNNQKTFDVCNNNKILASCIFTFFYYKQFIFFNNTFFKFQK